MKSLFILFSLIFGSIALNAQEINPVFWTCSYQAISETEGQIIIRATIEPGWHTYSQRPTEAGPIPTSFTFASSPAYQLVGKTIESDAHEEFVKAFEANIFVFHDQAEFKQKIKLNKKGSIDIKLSLEYMSCNDMMCLPPKTVELSTKTQ